MYKGPVAGSSLVAPGAEWRPVGTIIGDKVVVGGLFGLGEKLGSESSASLTLFLNGEWAATLHLAIRPSGPGLTKALLRNQPCGS